MELSFEVQLHYANDTHVTLVPGSDPDYFTVDTITSGRVLHAYQKLITASNFTTGFTAFEDYDAYQVFVDGLAGTGFTKKLKDLIRQTFSFMKVYLEWDEVHYTRKGYMAGAEIYFCAPEVSDSWFFKDKVGNVEIKFAT